MAKNEHLLTAELIGDISTELSLARVPVENTLKLLLDDCTVPFIARYRKEATGALDEVQIRDIRDRFEYLVALAERKDAILKSIEEQGKLTPELKNKIQTCKVKSQLEDLYLPYKPKKRTRGQIAKERGLEPLALEVFAQDPSLTDLTALCMKAVGTHEDLKTLENVIQGVKDYIAEVISEIPELRGEVRVWTFENAVFRAQVKDEFKEKRTKYTDYYDFAEPVKTIAAHRLMALRRGEKEEILKVTLDFEPEAPISIIESRIIKPKASDAVRALLKDCVADAFNRLLAPSIETELRLETRSRAEEEAINVFAKNLRNLLLLPPIPKRTVLGVDPGMRTGSKLVAVDQTGKLLEYTTIYPDHTDPATTPKNANAADKLLDLVKKHNIDYIAIGNGTGGREMEHFIESALEKLKDKKIRVVMINESGASVYSASDVAREEFPDLDITYRGAVSIARRLQDPLAELVKIDPKSIGVGQYQHDVNQSKLKKSLEEIVESCVNYVGVNLNTASPSLLSYVAGIGPTLAKNIVKHRENNGEFKSREALFEVMGYGPKVFEQSAGFLRVPESANPLDNTAVHPEAYKVVEKMAAELSMNVADLIGKRDVVSKISLEKYVTEELGMPTLQDIVKELLKPGRDPREDGAKHSYNRDVKDFDQLKEGQTLTGTVTNVTNFGAFVDIGVHQDGLVHISEISNKFIQNPAEAVAVGSQVKVKVIGVDRERRRISLSMKALEEGATQPQAHGGQPQQRAGAVRSGGEITPRGGERPQTRPTIQRNNERRPQPQMGGRQQASSSSHQEGGRGGRNQRQEDQSGASLSDLLNKFNSKRL